MENNLRDLPRKGQEIASQPNLRLEKGSHDLLPHPLKNSPKLVENFATKPITIKGHSKLE
jgi:hypothetical protein